MQRDEFDFLTKVVLIGDINVGKTNLLNLLTGRAPFNPEYKATEFIEYGSVTVETTGGVKLRLQILDRGGRKANSTVVPSACYSDTGILLLVLDLTERSSFDNLQQWIEEARANGKEGKDIILVANKSDGMSSVDDEELTEFARTNRLIGVNNNKGFIKTSAKQNFGIEALKGEIVAAFAAQNPGLYIIKPEGLATPVIKPIPRDKVIPTIAEAHRLNLEYRTNRKGALNSFIYAFSELFRSLSDDESMKDIKERGSLALDSALRGEIPLSSLRTAHPEAFADTEDRLGDLLVRIEGSNLPIPQIQASSTQRVEIK